MGKYFKVCIFICIVFFPLFSHGADFSIAPSSSTIEVGERVTVKINVASSASLNAVSGEVLFPPDLFAIESLSKSGSIIDFWVTEPSFSRTNGTFDFEGVSLSGFKGVGGTVLMATVRALKPGTGTVSFKTGQILANDGQGTNITGTMPGVTLSVIEAKPKPVPVKTTPVEEVKTQPTETFKPVSTLAAPEITLLRQQMNLFISGTSIYPRSKALVTFISEEGVKIFITGSSDDTGGFTVPVPTSLKHGVYNVNAIIVKDDGTNSLQSNTLFVTIGSIWSDVGIEIKIIFWILILLIIYLIWRIVHHVHKKLSPKIIQEVKEADHVAHDAFDILREDIDELGDMATRPSDRKKVREIRTDVDDAEKAIRKEIKDIE